MQNLNQQEYDYWMNAYPDKSLLKSRLLKDFEMMKGSVTKRKIIEDLEQMEKQAKNHHVQQRIEYWSSMGIDGWNRLVKDLDKGNEFLPHEAVQIIKNNCFQK